MIKQRRGLRRVMRYALIAAGIAALTTPLAAQAVSPSEWPQYLFGPGHYSYNGSATAITGANAGGLHQAWTWLAPTQPGDTAAPRLNGSPTVAGGTVYLGASDGWFYAVDEATGQTLASANLGYVSGCSSRLGISSTATVVADPARGGALTAYVTAGKPGGSTVGGNYLWALDGSTLRTVSSWGSDPVTVSAQRGSYAWSSPTVSGGHVYVGLSSGCDHPLVRGGVASVDQGTGRRLGTWWAVPAKHTDGTSGNVGGTVWSTVAVDSNTGDLFATTGNADEANFDGHGCNCAQPGDSYSIVRVNGSTMAERDHWTDGTALSDAASKGDQDFGGSATTFQGNLNGTPTGFVGACNKDGWYYVLQRSNLAAGLTWKFRIGAANGIATAYSACLSAAAFDATARQVVIGGNTSSGIDGRSYPGSVRGLSTDIPAAHRVFWDDGLPCNVLGTPSINGNGLVAAATYGTYSATKGKYLSCDPAAAQHNSATCNDTDGTPHLYILDGRHPVANPSGRPDAPVLWCAALPSGAFAQPTFADGYLLVASGAAGAGIAPAQLTAFTP